MRVGLTLFPQNYDDWPRFLAAEHDRSARTGPALSDRDVLLNQFSLADEAEALGLDSVWSVEHHFAPYTMITNPLQVLSYFAGRTERIDLGTCVVVLPWHHPVRVAEDASMLQHLMGPERDLLLGVGRGLGQREFAGMGVDMNDSRSLFSESVEIIKMALTQEFFSYEGKHYQIPERSIRPLPLDGRIRDNMHCAWGSPQSVPVASGLGLKPIVIPQKQWSDYRGELEEFETTRSQLGLEPARPRIMTYMYCAPTEAEATEGAHRYMAEYSETVLHQYEILGEHFSKIQGYEHYAATSQHLRENNLGAVEMSKMFLENHIWGTPDQCFAQIEKIEHALETAPAELIVVPMYGSMGLDEAQRSLRLFAKEVVPAVQALS